MSLSLPFRVIIQGMDEQGFVSKKRENWDTLQKLVDKAGQRGGLQRLTREEVRQFGSLYRRVASDLAYVRSRATNRDLVTHLNTLLVRAYILLYDSVPSQKPSYALVNFYFYEFPALIQKYLRLFLFAISVSLAGAFFAYYMIIAHPESTTLFIPEQFKESLEIWKQGNISSPAYAGFSAQLFTHNTTIGFLAAASGVVGGVPTLDLLYQNGVTLGAFAAVMTQYHAHATFWPGILPHGIAELTAIFICGAAGLLIGRAVLFPGKYRRLDALRIHGLEAIKLTLGTIPLFIFAGIIEGMFSHLAIPAALRYAFAALNGVLWYAYLFIPRIAPEIALSASNEGTRTPSVA